jgi:ribonuclease D
MTEDLIDFPEDFQVCDRDLEASLLDRYLQASSVAVDTETMGLNYQRDRLCLVQLCAPGIVTIIRIAKDQTEAPLLAKLMTAPHITKVFHFARFDVAQLRHRLGIETNPIFCTKIASKLVRTYSPKHGLKDLVFQLEGVELDKSSQSSDWGNAANLSEAQLSYAANDVRYLISVKDKLTVMLQREDRWELAQQCFAALPTMVSLDILQYGDIFSHH